jgi:HEAT repeat protein
MATDFFWRGPEDAIEPLIEAMDRSFGNYAMKDTVRNTVEAMGKMANEAFDAALQRALEHKDPNVRQAALTALATSGKAGTVRDLFRFFPQMDGRSRVAWLRAVRLRLGDDAVPLLRELMMADFHSSIRDEVLRETLQLPAKQAAEILRGRWPVAIGEFKAIIAGVLHATGDTAGSVWLRESLAGEDLTTLGVAIKHCAFGELGILRDSVLALSSHPRADVRFVLAQLLQKIPGEDVADVYELLSAPEEAWDTKAIALRELTRRGRPKAASALLEELPTATGTRLQLVLEMLSASGDARAVPIFVERFEKAPAGEGRAFLQALAKIRGDAACDAMLKLFLGPDRLVDRGGPGGHPYTTTNYLPTLMMNLRGSEARLVEAFGRIDKADWKHRAALLPTIAGLASDREDPAITALCIPVVRAVLFDRGEIPQMRVLALNLLTRRYLSLDDAMLLKNTRHEEAAGLRALFADYLNDYF